MVRGARLCILATLVAATTLVKFPEVTGLKNQIKKSVYNNNGFGSYSFEFETSDGTYRREDGGIVDTAGEENMVVRGEYVYTDPDGQRHYVKYVADSNGFQPQREDGDTRFNDRWII